MVKTFVLAVAILAAGVINAAAFNQGWWSGEEPPTNRVRCTVTEA